MKRHILVASPVAAVLAAIVFWAHAQPSPQPMASIFPSGALLYLEAKDFSALLAAWNGSAEKHDWLAGSNYETFARSTLFLKLTDAQTEFAAAAGVPPDDALLSSVAGSNSAAAIYDIGKLQFLYVTHLASARVLNTSFWKTRGTYQTRRAGNANYFMKEDRASHRIAAFAYVGDTLLLATREDLIAGALQLMAREPLPSVASEPWFTEAAQAGAAPGDLRLVYNMAALARAFQFRSYWVQSNVPDLRQFSAGLADLDRTAAEFRERRILLRATSSEATVNSETAAGQLLAAVPDDAGLYRAWLHPAAGQPAQLIAEKLFPQAIASPAPSPNLAPQVSETAETGSEIDLESRIDERPLTADPDALKPLRDFLASKNIDAMLDVSSAQLDPAQVFVRPHSAIALLANQPWDANAVRASLGSVAEGVWSNSATATWSASANGIQQLDGVGKLAVAIDGKWMIVGDSVDMVNAVFARRNRAAIAGASYAAGWRHARELPNFERMVSMIDFPQAPPEPGAAAGAEPPFFSANMASLGRALHRVDRATIVVHDEGASLRESVVYQLNP